MEESKLLRVLRHAAELEYFTGTDLSAATGLSWAELWNYGDRIWSEIGVRKEGIFELESGGSISGSSRSNARQEDRYRITYPAMMHWLEYVDLSEARASSLSAQKNAVTSIRIAIGAIAISSVFAAILLFLVLTTGAA